MDSIGLNDNLEDIDSGRMSKWASSSHDRQALAALHHRFYPKVSAFITSRVGPAEDAEDLVQDVFTELHRNNGWYDRAEDPENYILGIARNLVRQHYRKRATSIRTISIEEIGPVAASHDRRQDSDPESRLQKQELTEAIEEILANMPPKARQARKLRFTDDLTTKEAAKKSGCTPSAFRKRIYRILARIRSRLRSRNEQRKK